MTDPTTDARRRSPLTDPTLDARRLGRVTDPRRVAPERRGGALLSLAALGLAVLAALGALSCAADDTAAGPQVLDHAVVFAADSLAAVDTLRTASGLEYLQLTAGSGRRAGRGSIVAVHYTGMLTDGTVFDSSYPRGAPFRFVLGQGRVIAGWDEGIALMQEGARGRLVVPPGLGYGDAGSGPIPGGATLWFDVWLVDVD